MTSRLGASNVRVNRRLPSRASRRPDAQAAEHQALDSR
jgi:hypothetical protein